MGLLSYVVVDIMHQIYDDSLIIPSPFAILFDVLQSTFKCCGFEGKDDFKNLNFIVPASCCKKSNVLSQNLDISQIVQEVLPRSPSSIPEAETIPASDTDEASSNLVPESDIDTEKEASSGVLSQTSILNSCQAEPTENNSYINKPCKELLFGVLKTITYKVVLYSMIVIATEIFILFITLCFINAF